MLLKKDTENIMNETCKPQWSSKETKNKNNWEIKKRYIKSLGHNGKRGLGESDIHMEY